MRRPKTNRHLRTLLQLLGCCAAILCIWQVPKIGSNFVVYLVSRILFMGLMAMSMNLLMGFGGLTSLAQAGFAGISGYAFAICRATYKMDYIPSVLIALGLVLAVAVLFGFLSSRTSGTTFMMMTLALANLIHLCSLQWSNLTRGDNGIIGVRGPKIFGTSYISTRMTIYLIAVVVVLAFFLAKRLTRSPFGMAIQGMRDNSVKMNSLGFNVQVIRIILVAVSSLFAGLAGILLANFYATMAPDNVTVSYSMMCLFMGVIGGSAYIEGGFIGAAIYILVLNYVSQYTQYDDAVVGVLFILAVFLIPRGIAGIKYFHKAYWDKRRLAARKTGPA